MAQAYVPSLDVLESTIVRRERRLPLKGSTNVKVGDMVEQETVVASTELPGKPVPISNSEAKRISDQVIDGVERARPAVMYDVGEQVKVIDGPFASFNGEIETIDEEKARLRVAVSIFGRSTPVDLEYSQVEKV